MRLSSHQALLRLLAIVAFFATVIVSASAVAQEPTRTGMSLPSPAPVPTDRSDRLIKRLIESGADISPKAIENLRAYSARAERIQNSSNAYASLGNDGVTFGHRVLICAKMKAALIFKVEGGLCGGFDGTVYLISGSGYGLSEGIGVDVVTILATGNFLQTLKGVYRGVSVGFGAGKRAMLIAPLAKLLKAMPLGIKPSFGMYSRFGGESKLYMLGVQVGPMFDLSQTDLRLSDPMDLLY